MALTRTSDWLEQLHSYIEAQRLRRYHAVRNNCCTFVAGGILAMTGADVARQQNWSARSLRAVAELLERQGGVRGMATAVLGEPRPPLLARRGDVVLFAGVDGEAIALCVDSDAVMVTRDGLARLALTDCIASWQVG
ncbi:DUF6950 family protein [Hydrocarboniphaga sp.]|uniref:DUF6950 family protein n=1 Tax=Hydrocarboniphaga sp. TaxID=2033016 RepID=UPI003D10224A